jgi:4-amino-4-deoxy-L-arabinose transferase-like glycosyltransferase
MAKARYCQKAVGIVFPSAAIFLLPHTTSVTGGCWQDWNGFMALRCFHHHGSVACTDLIAKPEFPHFYFIHEHVERFLTTVHRREAPWWSFIAITMPGLDAFRGLALFPAITHGWRDPALRIGKPTALPSHRLNTLLLFSAFVLLFSQSSSKLPGYILPIFPAAGIGVGHLSIR